MRTLHLTKEHFDENGWYIGEANVTNFEGSIEIAAGLGWCRFKASVRASRSVVALAGTGIKAGEGIEAGRGIEAGEGIEAGGTLRIAFRIFAGIANWLKTPSPEQKRISCKRLESGEVCYGELVETEKAEANV